jgi:serine/threonine-protein kinase RsbW
MSTENALTVTGRYGEVRTICAFVVDGARAAGLDDDLLFHIELCCDEAATNIIEHAYGSEGAGDITVRYVSSPQAFTIYMYDNGRAFEPEDVPEPFIPIQDVSSEPEINDVMESMKVGGLGIHFMRKLMDDVQFSFDGRRGNMLKMTKRLTLGAGQ